jgi:hypothetical protein
MVERKATAMKSQLAQFYPWRLAPLFLCLLGVGISSLWILARNRLEKRVSVEVRNVNLSENKLHVTLRIEGTVQTIHTGAPIATDHTWIPDAVTEISGPSEPRRSIGRQAHMSSIITFEFRRHPHDGLTSLPRPAYSSVIVPITLSNRKRVLLEVVIDHRQLSASNKAAVSATVFSCDDYPKDYYAEWIDEKGLPVQKLVPDHTATKPADEQRREGEQERRGD